MNNQKVVIAGGGYSAVCVFNLLEKYLSKSREPVDVLFVSNKNYYFFENLLPDFLCDTVDYSDISQELRSVVFLKPGVSFLQTKILGIDLSSKTINTPKGEITYSYLILAPENESGNLYEVNNREGENNCFYFNMPTDVIRLKNHIVKNIELASNEHNIERKKALLTFSLISNGLQTLEIAFSLSDYVHNVIKGKYPEIKSSQVKVNIFEEKNVISKTNNSYLNNKLFYFLNKKNISLFLNSFVTSIFNEKIEINNKDEIYSGTIVCPAKEAPPSLIKDLKLKKDENFNASVNLFLNADGFENVFVIGPFSKCLDLGDDYAHSVLWFKNQAICCATNILAKINNNPLKAVNPPIDLEFYCLGYKNSLVMHKNVYLDGFIPWLLYRSIYISSLLGWKKKFKASVKLLLNLLGLSDNMLIDVQEPSVDRQLVKK